MTRPPSESYLVVPKKEAMRFGTECLQRVSMDSEDAETVAHHLMYADYKGIFAFGINKIGHYIHDIEMNLVDSKAKPKILNDFQAIALVDGCNGIGAVVGKYCMRMAIEKAHRFGIGFVSARGSNHFGICGYYTQLAMERGMIGFTASNSSPLICPTRSTTRCLGSNPFSLGMTGSGGEDFLLDMATSTMSLSKIELYRQENTQVPVGVAIDKDGNDLTDPDKIMESPLILPLGGREATGGFKGYGLAVMVEVLCGILSGSEYGPNIRFWSKESTKVANLGQCFMAINPDVIAPGAKGRLTRLMAKMREAPHLPDTPPIRLPGDGEKAHMAKVDAEGGIKYPSYLLENFGAIADKMGVEPIKMVRKRS